MKAYSNKSNAKRAAISQLSKARGLTKEQVKEQEGVLYTIETHPEGGFFWRLVQTEVKCEQKPIGNKLEEKVNLVSLIKLTKPTKKTKQQNEQKTSNKPFMPPKNGMSFVKNPCKLVWEIADKMQGARRKDVIQACVEAGVVFYTARTQYQLWYKAKNSRV